MKKGSRKKDIFEKVPDLKRINDIETFLNQKGTLTLIKGRLIFVEDEEGEDESKI